MWMVGGRSCIPHLIMLIIREEWEDVVDIFIWDLLPNPQEVKSEWDLQRCLFLPECREPVAWWYAGNPVSYLGDVGVLYSVTCRVESCLSKDCHWVTHSLSVVTYWRGNIEKEELWKLYRKLVYKSLTSLSENNYLYDYKVLIQNFINCLSYYF